MGITPPKDFEKRIEEQLRQQAENTIRMVTESLMEIGMSAVNTIRANHAYKDQTGNLTSSVGCAVVVNGQIIQGSEFAPIKPTGEPGSQAGQSFVRNLASIHNDTTLIAEHTKALARMDANLDVMRRAIDNGAI